MEVGVKLGVDVKVAVGGTVVGMMIGRRGTYSLCPTMIMVPVRQFARIISSTEDLVAIPRE